MHFFIMHFYKKLNQTHPYMHDTTVGIGKQNHNTEVEKSAGMSSLQKIKSILLFVCIIIIFKYLNSFTIGQNTHIKKIL